MVATKAPPQNSLTVIDNRTGKQINIPITHNSIPATAFKQLKAPKQPGERDEDDHANGIRVFDPAFLNTAAISSKITYIDGEKGFLMHRGYPIEQLAEKSTFLETAYLLIYGELPSPFQAKLWEFEVMHHTFLAEDLMKIISAMRYDSHPMSVFISAFAAMGAFAPEANPALQGRNLYIEDKATMNKNIIRIIGKAATVAAASMRVRMNRPFIAPRSDMSYTENMLYMMDAMSEGENYRPDKRLAKALDVLFILHADHEMNCSTAAMTHVGSSMVDPYSAISAAAAALYGPLHGGANEAVIRMIERIGKVENIPQFLEDVKSKKELLFGFGHRVYRNTDPRSKIIREVADTVFEVLGREPLIEVAIELKEAALRDDFFVKRKLFPNVDYWSGLIYKAMGFPLDFFPILFAVPRVAGWLAHWKQSLDAGNVKIWRPRQVYVGEGRRDYVEMKDREERVVRDPKGGVTELPHYQSKRRMAAKL
ncbi:citrate synthase-like protein [Kalaharituber pfeilii]|nr:citrate synthase-like protein [Kalaharituber pfeilii]